jgi:hypothetical protein
MLLSKAEQFLLTNLNKFQMKLKHSIIGAMLVATVLSSSCEKNFDELVVDPNRPTEVPASLVLSGILNDYYQAPWNNVQRWNQFYCCNYNYYGNQEYAWTGVSYNYFLTLKNVNKMVEEALRTSSTQENPYSVLAKFFRAHFMYDLSMRVGDLPMKEALLGLDNPTPKYDSQKEIMLQVLKWLEEANNEIAGLISKGNALLSGDFYYNNNLSKWQKAINAMRLRVLIQLSKKEADTDLNIKSRISSLLNNSTANPLFAGNSDNLQYVYNDRFNKYPVSPDNYGFDATRYNMSATYLNKLVELKDPRTFVIAEPAPKRLSSGKKPSEFDAYNGASSGEDLADMSTKANNGEYSWYNRKKYYTTYTAESCIQLGYPEMCFNIAEAINRGYVSGDAEDWYIKGIQASINFYGIRQGENTFYYQKPGGNNFDNLPYAYNFDWASYYGQSSVKLSADKATALQQILQQKYLAFFQNSGWEAYYNWRRTGVPTFGTGPGTANSQRIPKRFLYPSGESVTNAANVKEAIQRQFGGTDDINSEMWIIK